MTLEKKKGIIPIIPLVIGGVFTLFASVGGAWITASASAQREIGNVNTELQIVKTTEGLHYKELKDDLNEIKVDIKDLLELSRNK